MTEPMIGTRVEVLNVPIDPDRCTSCSVDYRERGARADLSVRVGNAKLRLCVKCAVVLWKKLVPHIFKNVEIQGDDRPADYDGSDIMTEEFKIRVDGQVIASLFEGIE